MNPLVASPCSTPGLTLDQALAAYAGIGFRRFEAFTGWVKSALDPAAPAIPYREHAARHGMAYHSMHLPAITPEEAGEPRAAIDAATFAAELGCDVVLFKAVDLATYQRAAGPYLDATADLPVTPVLQNHAGSALATPDDFREVLAGIADPRMKTLLEVGHFHTVGVDWREGLELLGDSVALVHIKDQVGPQSVPFGTGEIDLPGLFERLEADGYEGGYVVEMEVADPENTLGYLEQAYAYCREHGLGEAP
jgi:sugar phosphate isomerase/epimerase